MLTYVATVMSRVSTSEMTVVVLPLPKLVSTLLLYLWLLLLLLLLSLATRLFFLLLLLLNQRWSPPLSVPVSLCITLRIMCVVPSTAVCCTESIQCLPAMAYTFSYNRLLLLRWLQLIPSIIVYFLSHIIVLSLYMDSWILASFLFRFGWDSCPLIFVTPSISIYIYFLFFIFNYHIWSIWGRAVA